MYEVFDARTGNVIGPYSEKDARTVCRDLNWYVLRNTMPVLADLVGSPDKVTGPFYLRPCKEMSR